MRGLRSNVSKRHPHVLRFTFYASKPPAHFDRVDLAFVLRCLLLQRRFHHFLNELVDGAADAEEDIHTQDDQQADLLEKDEQE